MANMTLSVPSELKQKMDKRKEINWSEIARQAFKQKILMLEKFDELLSNSELDLSDIKTHSKKVKKSVWRKHKKAA